MRPKNTAALAAVGVFVSLQVSSCGHMIWGAGGGNVDQLDAQLETPDPAVLQKNSQKFLDEVGNDPIRGKHPDSVLIDEARKVCHELYQGKSDKDVADMIRKDLGPAVDPDDFALSATIAFCPANSPG